MIWNALISGNLCFGCWLCGGWRWAVLVHLWGGFRNWLAGMRHVLRTAAAAAVVQVVVCLPMFLPCMSFAHGTLRWGDDVAVDVFDSGWLGHSALARMICATLDARLDAEQRCRIICW